MLTKEGKEWLEKYEAYRNACKEANQKLRTLRLMSIMLERTDEKHILNTTQLCSILEQEYRDYLQKVLENY